MFGLLVPAVVSTLVKRVGSRSAQILAGIPGKAFAVILAVVIFVAGVVWVKDIIADGASAAATATRDAVWTRKNAIETDKVRREERAEQRKIIAAADDERAILSDELEAARNRAAELEKEISRLNGESGDPVVIPKTFRRTK